MKAAIFLFFLLPGCGALFGAPRDLNGDGKISTSEAIQPAASFAKSGLDTALPASKPITDFIWNILFPASTGAGAYVLSKKGSKKRHGEQEERHKEEMKSVREENKKLKDLIVSIAAKTGVAPSV